MAGLRPQPYNLNALQPDSRVVYMVEGEKKAIFLSRCLQPVIGFPGVGFLDDAVQRVTGAVPALSELVIIPDPDALQAVEEKRSLRIRGARVSVVDLMPGYKPDDFLLRYGAEAMRLLIEQRRALT